MRTLLTAVLVLVLPCAAQLLAASPVPEQNLSGRMSQLEAETQALRAELQWLRENPVRLPGIQAIPTGMSSELDAANAAEETDYYTWEQLQEEIKKHAWEKGDFKIVPYGFLWANMVYETERSYVGDYTLYVISATDEGEDAFHVNAKSTRLGFDVTGPRLRRLNNALSGGKVEFDFQGNFAVENKPGVLLRHAYWEIKDDYFRLLAGQTWDVISPLYPGTIMYSVYWGAGNIGYRRPQFRAERYLHLSDTMLVSVQGALATDGACDFLGTVPAEGDHAGWPLIEGRLGFTLGPRGKGYRPIEVGVSGHVGEQIYDLAGFDDLAERTWSFNADLKAPIGERLGFQGEFFTGENLRTFLGGIVQGVDFGTREPIRSTGGWMEVWYDWTPKLHSHVGYCIDDPVDTDLTGLNKRRYNHCYWGNVIYDVTKQFNLGLEVGSWRTLYNDRAPGESVRLEFMAKYGF